MSTRVQKFIGPGDCNHQFRKPNALISRLHGAGEQAFNACSIGYIHGLICDSITCNTKELFNTLVHYNEEILGLPGAGGRPRPQSFKRMMNSAQPRAAAAAAAAGGDSAEDVADELPAPPPLVERVGEAEPPAAAAAPAGPAAGRRGKGGARA
jgi:hypothetical protein